MSNVSKLEKVQATESKTPVSPAVRILNPIKIKELSNCVKCERCNRKLKSGYELASGKVYGRTCIKKVVLEESIEVIRETEVSVMDTMPIFDQITYEMITTKEFRKGFDKRVDYYYSVFSSYSHYMLLVNKALFNDKFERFGKGLEQLCAIDLLLNEVEERIQVA